MNKKYSIATICVLGTSITGCTDPIVGYWTGTTYSYEDESINIPYSYDGVEIISAIDMEIESNLKGTFSYIAGDDNSYTDNITVTNEGNNTYNINLADDGSLSCTLAEKTLTCTYGEAGVTFEKGQ